MALGTEQLLEYLQKFKVLPELLKPILIGVVIIVISYQNVNFYMVTYRAESLFQDANGEFAMEAGLIARDLGQEYAIYALGEPRVFAGFPTLQFIAPLNPHMDLNADSLATLELQSKQKAIFFAIPENLALLDEIVKKYPNGIRNHFYRKTFSDEILFDYYVLTP
jgi:hypothetical protein